MARLSCVCQVIISPSRIWPQYWERGLGQGGRAGKGEGLVPVGQAMPAGISRGQCGSREARWMQEASRVERKEAVAWSSLLQGLSLGGSWEG